MHGWILPDIPFIFCSPPGNICACAEPGGCRDIFRIRLCRHACSAAPGRTGEWLKHYGWKGWWMVRLPCRAARSLLPGVPFPVNAGSRPLKKGRLPHGKMVIVPGTGERELPAGAGEWRFPSLPPWNPVLPWVRGLRGADGVVPGVHWLR